MTKKHPSSRWIYGIALLVSIILVPRPALAAVELARDFPVFADGKTVDVRGVSSSISLEAGQSVYISAKGTATSSTKGNLMQGMSVICGRNEYVWSTRNHEGKDAYVNAGGKLTVPVRFLFTAPSAGTYTCKLRVVCLRGNGAQSSDFLLLKAGETNTSLSLSSPLSGADKWGTENDFTDSDYAGEDADKGAIHIGPGLPAGDAEYALRSSRWQASSSASSVDAVGDVELTVCYKGTGSCPAYAHGNSAIFNSGSVVDTRLLVQQMPNASSNTPCKITYDPSAGFRRTAITTNAHHQKIFHRIANIPFSSACGSSRYFIIKVEVRWVRGNPIRIEPGSSSRGYSIGIAQNH